MSPWNGSKRDFGGIASRRQPGLEKQTPLAFQNARRQFRLLCKSSRVEGSALEEIDSESPIRIGNQSRKLSGFHQQCGRRDSPFFRGEAFTARVEMVEVLDLQPLGRSCIRKRLACSHCLPNLRERWFRLFP